MSKFINRKEEVIQIELTSEGRHLYSQGKFKPSFYAFFDDDILYDPDYAASASIGLGGNQYNPTRPIATETQNQIVSRLKETPRPSLQRTYQAAILNDTNIGKISSQGDPFDRETAANDKFLKPIGTSSPFSEYAPAWDIRTLPGGVDFSGSVTGSRLGNTDTNLAIPKLSCSIDINYIKSQIPGTNNGQEVDLPYWLLVEDGKLLIDVQEINTIFKSNGNFDVEVFKTKPRTSAQKRNNVPAYLKKLSFIDDSNIQDEVNGLLTKEGGDPAINFGSGDQSIEDAYPDLDDTYVSYYLSIRADKEIDDLAALKRSLPSDGIYSGTPSIPEDPCD